ncbi:MAG TPA: imidazolonepropionase [Blastocatellia bacterium]|nr:imidazolonepropionase [Blastocatellia bacterium]
MTELLIRGAKQVVTLAGPARPRLKQEMRELSIIEDGAVLTRDEHIVAVGKQNEVRNLASPLAEQIDAGGCVVMPGFVDAHTHPVYAGTREDEYEMRAEGYTYQQIAERGGGILSTVRKTRAASEDELFELAIPRLRLMLEHGTTTAEAKSGYGLSVEDELKILRVIRRLDESQEIDLVPTFLGAHEVPEEYRASREDYLDLVTKEMLPAVASQKLARYADVFCETRIFSVEEARRVLSRAATLGLGLRAHVEQLSLSGGAELCAQLKAASADHLEWVDDDGVNALQRSGVIALLLPGAVFNLGLVQYAPARKLIDAGVPVGLATDFNPGSSPTPSMQLVMSIACAQMKMTPAEAVSASTINPAYSLGLGASIGSIEPGKRADIVVYDCADYRQIPYLFGVNHASTVIKGGRVVYVRRS